MTSYSGTRLSISAVTWTLFILHCRKIMIRPAPSRRSVAKCTRHGDMHPKYPKVRKHPCAKPQNQSAIHGKANTCRIG
jgi:hypothetical protein